MLLIMEKGMEEVNLREEEGTYGSCANLQAVIDQQDPN